MASECHWFLYTNFSPASFVTQDHIIDQYHTATNLRLVIG
jgi:hypothetical protein